ncbi:cytochrome P450 [Favolaschia claudopus]|uniref:Cytochrome P450 n=1 Tax=Favolaschia claudopus TaxID=2862362 RepID=A0AAW0D5J2_9AGAR
MCAYGARHRQHGRLMKEVLAPIALAEYHAMEEEKTVEYLHRMSQDPKDLAEHMKLLIASIMFDISHAYTVTDKDDPMLKLAMQANDDFVRIALPGAYLCEVFPIMRYIPEWTGIRFKQDAKKFRKTLEALRDDAYEKIKVQVRNGTAKPSFTQSLVERNQNPTPEEESLYKWTSVATLSAMESFFVAMSVYPQVQERAHTELMNVVGTTRLPGFSDRPYLPYIEAMIQEILRWNPVGPLGLPHRLIQDVIYRGYDIPAGTILLANSWAMLHDPDVYPSPFEFEPERFLTTTTEPKLSADRQILNPDPRRHAFGYARRACPGQYLAEDALYIAIVRTLAVFRIGPMDKTKTVDDVEFAGIICHPKSLDCVLIPRSTEAVSLIPGL